MVWNVFAEKSDRLSTASVIAGKVELSKSFFDLAIPFLVVRVHQARKGML